MTRPEGQAEDAEDASSLLDQIHTSVNISSKHFSREKYRFCDTKCWKVRADAVARGETRQASRIYTTDFQTPPLLFLNSPQEHPQPVTSH